MEIRTFGLLVNVQELNWTAPVLSSNNPPSNPDPHPHPDNTSEPNPTNPTNPTDPSNTTNPKPDVPQLRPETDLSPNPIVLIVTLLAVVYFLAGLFMFNFFVSQNAEEIEQRPEWYSRRMLYSLFVIAWPVFLVMYYQTKTRHLPVPETNQIELEDMSVHDTSHGNL